MRFVTFAMLRAHVDLDGVDHEFLADGFRLVSRANGTRDTLIFTTIDKMEEDVKQLVLKNGWDPDTTLFLYDPPRTKEERAEAEAQTAKAIEEDPDWDDIQIGYVDPEQIHGTIYKDMTLERFAELLVKPWNLRVFS